MVILTPSVPWKAQDEGFFVGSTTSMECVRSRWSVCKVDRVCYSLEGGAKEAI